MKLVLSNVIWLTKNCVKLISDKIKFASGLFRLQDKVTELLIVKLKSQYIDQA